MSIPNALKMWTCGILVMICFQVPSAHGGQNVGPLRAAVLRHFPPQYSLSEDGHPQGFAIDVIEEIARIAGFEIEYLVKDTWAEMFEALKSGEADLIPNQGITERRKQWFAFSRPVETFPVSIFTRGDETEISGPSGLSGKKVGVVKLNVGQVLVRDHPEAVVRAFDHVQDALFHLLSGNVDAILFPEPVLWKLAREAGIEDRIQVVGKPLIEIRRAISVVKENRVLLARIDEAVSQFVGSEPYQEIYTRWYGKPKPYWSAQRVAGAMTAALVAVILLMGFWRFYSTIRLNRELREQVERRAEAERDLQEAYETLEEKVVERTRDLEEALDRVKTLSGLLPICSVCKKIRDDKGYWNQIEHYITEHSEAEFSHGICQECAEKVYQDIRKNFKP